MKSILHFACLVAASAGLSLLPLPAAAAAGTLTWKRDAGTVALLQNAQVVWQFNFGTNATKPFFHPVALPNGPVLTWNQPADHPWHHGLWFSWKFINGINYWEEDPKTGLANGQTSWREPELETRPDFSARIQMDLNYRPATNGPEVLTEHRVIEISRPDDAGVYHQDWSMIFAAGSEDVRLERTPLAGEPGGQSWGGYAGLSVRLAAGITEPQALTTREPVQFINGNYRGTAAAMDYTGSFEGHEAGLAILDCAKNLNSPSPWYAISGNPMHYFSPAVLCYQPHTLKAGQPLSLRYRVIVHPGRWTATQLHQASEHFAAEKH